MDIRERLPDTNLRENYRDYSKYGVGIAVYLTLELTAILAFLGAVLAGASVLGSLWAGDWVGAFAATAVWGAMLAILFGVQWFTFRYAEGAG